MARARLGGMSVNVSMKHLFFDTEHVRDKIGEANARAMKKALHFIMYGAQKSMKTTAVRTKTAKPGKPPKRHFGEFNQGLGRMQHFYDENAQTGVVGPIKQVTKTSKYVTVASPAPNAMEFGGSRTFRLIAFTKEGEIIDDDGMANVTVKMKAGRDAKGRYLKSRKETVRQMAVPHQYRYQRGAKPRRVYVKARPFMGPSLERETAKGNVLSSWGNEVHE